MTVGAHARGAVLALAFAAALLGTSSTARADVTAQGCSARAVVVVETNVVPICFDGAISGLDALRLAGANPVTYGFAGQGAAVCQLYGRGNPADQSCLIGPGGQYWAYFRAAPGATGWTYSRGGASSSTVVDGSVEGWRYGTGAAPGFVSFCSVVSCAPPPTAPPPPPPTAAPPPVAAPVTPAAPPANGSAATPDPAAASGGETTKPGAADGVTATTGEDGTPVSTGKQGTVTGERSSRRDQSDTVEVAAGGGGGSDDPGSPVGVIVAVAVVALGAGAGLWLRRRRGGPAPG